MAPIESRVIRNFIRTAKVAGFDVVSASDGEERHKVDGEKAAMEVVNSVDTSWLYFAKRDETGRRRESLVIILGNGAECLSDMSCGRADWDAVVETAFNYVDGVSA